MPCTTGSLTSWKLHNRASIHRPHLHVFPVDSTEDPELIMLTRPDKSPMKLTCTLLPAIPCSITKNKEKIKAQYM